MEDSKIAEGQKFKPARGEERFSDRTITVISPVVNHAGRVLVESENHKLGIKKRQLIKAKSLLSSAYTLVPALVLAFVMTGCASAPPKSQVVTCGRAPTSYITNDAGVPTVAILTCYRADGLLSYEAHAMTPEQIKEAAAALQAAKPNPSPADPCSDKQGLDYTVCRKAQHKKPAPLKAVK